MSDENVSPAVMRRVMKEIKDLLMHPVEDIVLITNDSDILDIQAQIQGPAGTPYEGGVFRVKIKLGAEFPQVPPKGYFLTKIFHPNVSNIGEICVNTLKKDWTEDMGIKHILLTVKCLLIVPNPESALNEEAGRLLLECYDDYCRQAKLMTSIHAKPLSSSDSSAATQASATSSSTSTAAVQAKEASAAAPKKPDAKKRAMKRL